MNNIHKNMHRRRLNNQYFHFLMPAKDAVLFKKYGLLSPPGIRVKEFTYCDITKLKHMRYVGKTLVVYTNNANQRHLDFFFLAIKNSTQRVALKRKNRGIY